MGLSALATHHGDRVQVVFDNTTDLDRFDAQLSTGHRQTQLAVATSDQRGVVGPIDINTGRPGHRGRLNGTVEDHTQLLTYDACRLSKDLTKSMDWAVRAVAQAIALGQCLQRPKN